MRNKRRLICRIVLIISLMLLIVPLMGFVSIMDTPETKAESRIKKSKPVCSAHIISRKEKVGKISKIDIYREPPYYELTVEATAYTHTGNNTSSGIYPYVGSIASDWNVIPPYSKVYIPGYGNATVLDTGGAIKGHKIDVFYDTVSECDYWGRRVVTIKVYTE